jgi:single-strand DNA-binding protein
MANYNKVVLVGRLTRDVETRTIPSGATVAKFGFAVSTNRKKNPQTGQWEDEPMFIDCEAWNRSDTYKLADTIRDFCRKGSQILIEGELRLDQWQDKTSGQNRSKHKIVVNAMQLLDPKQPGSGGGPRPSGGGGSYSQEPQHSDGPPDEGGGPPAGTNEDIPF